MSRGVNADIQTREPMKISSQKHKFYNLKSKTALLYLFPTIFSYWRIIFKLYIKYFIIDESFNFFFCNKSKDRKRRIDYFKIDVTRLGNQA